MVNSFTFFIGKSTCSIRHHSFSLSSPYSRTKVGALTHTIKTFFFHALRSVTWDHNISNLHTSHPRTHTFNDGSCLMTKDTGPTRSSATAAFKLIDISMTKSIRNYFDSNFSSFWWSDPNFLNYKRFFGLISDGCLTQNRLWLNHSLINYQNLYKRYVERLKHLKISLKN